jgi:hypothetical protein
MPYGVFEFGNDRIFCLLHHYPLGGLPDIARIECTTMTNAAYARVKLDPRRNTGWMYPDWGGSAVHRHWCLESPEPRKSDDKRQAREEQDHEDDAPERHLVDVPKHQDASRAICQSLKRSELSHVWP